MSIYKRKWLVICVVAGMLISTRATTAPTVYAGTTKEELKAFIEMRAIQFGVDPALAKWIVEHESQYDTGVVGDKTKGVSLGLWQINLRHNPQVPAECSLDADCATVWAMKQLKAGKKNLWSSVKFCRKLYKNDCPR